MDTRTGEILSPEKVQKLRESFQSMDNASNEAAVAMRELNAALIEMKIPPTPKQMSRRPPKVGRNEPCPCGSGKKFKKCCYMKI